eukprot:scaffold259_cov158-Amphora_coffeaeformis.AAC.3
MPTNIITTLVFASVLLFSSQVSQTCADKVKGVRRHLADAPEKHDPKRGQRSVIAALDKVSFKCNSRLKGPSPEPDEINDQIDFAVENRADGVRVNVNYGELSGSDGAETQSTTTTTIMVNYDSIVEYKKNESMSNDYEAFNWEYDEILQQIKLSDTTIGMYRVTPPPIAGGNDLGMNLTANKMKIDFELVNFPWMETDSYVALLSTVEAEKRIEQHVAPPLRRMAVEEDITNNTNETGTPDEMPNEMPPPPPKSPPPPVEITNLSIDLTDSTTPQGLLPFGSYTWAKEAMVVTTNTSVQVVATSPLDMSSIERVGMDGATSGPMKEDKVNYIAFSFVGNAAAHEAKDLFWDPETSVEYNSSSAWGMVALSVPFWLTTMAGTMFAWMIVV